MYPSITKLKQHSMTTSSVSSLKKQTSSVSFSSEILAEILKRLPVKSLLRFKCVQKSWYDLIQDPYFINVHSPDPKNKNTYLLFASSSKTSFTVFNNKQGKVYCPWTEIRKHIPGYTNLHKCRSVTSNGLLCLSGFEGRVQHVYLWNLLTRKVKTLFNSPLPCDHDAHIRLVEAGVAFGYLAEINDYKVIKLEIYVDARGEPLLTLVNVNVYSLSTNSWKSVTIDNFSGSSSFKFLYGSVVVDGAAYWIGSKAESEKVVVCFDIDKEIFQEIILPQSDKFSTFKLIGFGEEVYVFYHHNSIVEILTPEGETKENWTKKVTLDLDKIKRGCIPLGFSNNGDLVLKSCIENQHLFYNIEKAETTKVVEDALLFLQPLSPCPFFMSVFYENLVLLGDDDLQTST